MFDFFSIATTDQLLQLTVILLSVLILLVALALLYWFWQIITNTPCLIKIVFALGVFIVGLVLIWLIEPSLVAGTELEQSAIQQRLLRYWREVDGFARSHPWIGALLVASLPLLLWPSGEKENG